MSSLASNTQIEVLGFSPSDIILPPGAKTSMKKATSKFISYIKQHYIQLYRYCWESEFYCTLNIAQTMHAIHCSFDLDFTVVQDFTHYNCNMFIASSAISLVTVISTEPQFQLSWQKLWCKPQRSATPSNIQ